MVTVAEIQTILENLTKTKIAKAEIARALNTGRANISARAKSNSILKADEIKKLEEKFNVVLDNSVLSKNKIYQNIPVQSNVNENIEHSITYDNENKHYVYTISTKLLKSIGADVNASEIYFIKGDSMHPSIESGDCILVDKSKKEISDGCLYFVKINNELCARRLQKILPDRIKIISDNKEKYEPIFYYIEKSNFHFEIIGEILWLSRVAK